MALAFDGGLAPFARREAVTAGLDAPERERALTDLVGEIPRAALATDPPAEVAERLSRAGLAFLRDDRLVPVDPEMAAALAAAAIPLDELVATRAQDAREARAIAFSAARAIRNGTLASEVLSKLPDALPYEDTLYLAALLRIAAVAEAGAASGEPAIERAAAEATSLIFVGAADAVLSRATSALAALAVSSPRHRARLFSDAVVRLFSSVDEAAAIGEIRAPVDLLVSAIFAGGEATDPVDDRLEPYRRYAARHAWLAGRVAAREPAFVADLVREIDTHRGGDAFEPLPALLLGLGEGPDPAPPIRDALLAYATSGRTPVRQAALRALCARRDDHPDVLAILAAASRDPDEAVRVELASALLRAGRAVAPIVARLADDPSAPVRGAAAWSAVSRNEISPDLLANIEADLHHGSPALRRSAACAAACLGATDPRVGEALHFAGSAEAADGATWAGLERWASPAFAFALWASTTEGAEHLYARAADDDLWLAALGAAFATRWPGVPSAPAALREPIRIRALRLLATDDETVRSNAALVIGRHAKGDRLVLDTLTIEGRLPAELLEVLAIASPEIGLASPALVPGLFAVLDEEDDTDDLAPKLAVRCLGELAVPDDDRTATRLSTLASAAGPHRDAAYEALTRLVARR